MEAEVGSTVSPVLSTSRSPRAWIAFELHGAVAFGDTTAKLPELLGALRGARARCLLGDGTYGVLPEEWLRKYGVLAGLGTVTRIMCGLARAR